MAIWPKSMIFAVLFVLLAGCRAAGTGTPPSYIPSVSPPTAPPRGEVQLRFITTAEAYALAESGEGILYDTRSLEEYQVGHAAGAVSFPEVDVAVRYDELPTDKALVFY